MNDLHCIFSEPIELESNDYEFSVLDCTGTDSLVQNPSSGAEFFVEKKIDYGDVLILVFLFLFSVFGITKAIMDFFVPRRVTKF